MTENKCSKVGFVGAGAISELHFEGIQRRPERVQPVAMCDPDRATLEARCDKHGVPGRFETVEEMIENAELDAAIVCTPTHVRLSVLEPLLAARIPVFCEKPFAETWQEAEAAAALARRTGVPVAVNQNFRRHFTFDLAKRALAEENLGKPLHLVQSAMGLRRDKGWRLDRKRYVMAVMSIHWFDGYRYLFDEEPAAITCRGLNSPATPGGEDTAVSILLEFPSGVVVSLSESFSSWTRQSACTLDCENGGLILGYGEMTEIRADGEKTVRPNPHDKAAATFWLLEDLLEAVEEGRQPETNAADNMLSMRVMEAAYLSLNEKRTVRMEEVG